MFGIQNNKQQQADDDQVMLKDTAQVGQAADNAGAAAGTVPSDGQIITPGGLKPQNQASAVQSAAPSSSAAGLDFEETAVPAGQDLSSKEKAEVEELVAEDAATPSADVAELEQAVENITEETTEFKESKEAEQDTASVVASETETVFTPESMATDKTDESSQEEATDGAVDEKIEETPPAVDSSEEDSAKDTEEEAQEEVESQEDEQKTEEPAAELGSSDKQKLAEMKKKALGELNPLIEHLDQAPEEAFKTAMMMVEASHDSKAVEYAYESAQKIKDEKTKAQALLDVVEQINKLS